MWKKISASFLAAIIQQSAFCEPVDELEATFERFNHKQRIDELEYKRRDERWGQKCFWCEQMMRCNILRYRKYDVFLTYAIDDMKKYDKLEEKYPESLLCLQRKINKLNKIIGYNPLSFKDEFNALLPVCGMPINRKEVWEKCVVYVTTEQCLNDFTIEECYETKSKQNTFLDNELEHKKRGIEDQEQWIKQHMGKNK